MTAHTANKLGQYIKYTMISLVVIILVLGIFLARATIALHREDIINAQKVQLSALKAHGPLTAQEVTVIRAWMTFDYINKLFDLPPEYLQTNLSITDPSYPRLSLYGYSNKEHINSAVLTNEVENSVYDYLISASASSTN